MKTQKRILLLEDNLLTARGLQYLLQQEGYVVELAETVSEFWDALEANIRHRYALVILDVNLPDGNGFRLAEKVHGSGLKVPVIFLTARDDEADIVRGLELGAEDYITKPFRNRELVARINAVWRRSALIHDGQAENDELIAVGPFRVDPKTGEIFISQTPDENSATLVMQQAQKNQPRSEAKTQAQLTPLELTALERKLLNLLLEQPGRVVTRERLLDEIWDASGSIVNDNTISVYLRRLRKKLPTPGIVETVKNLGYRLRIPNDSSSSIIDSEGAKTCGAD